MAIDPWVYTSGTPPAAGSAPFRPSRQTASSQGFASFLRSSLDQAMSARAAPAASAAGVKHQTSSGSNVVRGQVSLNAALAAPGAAETAVSGQAAQSRPETDQAALTAEEESVLLGVAALQAKSVKTPSPAVRPRADAALAVGGKASPGLDALPGDVAAAVGNATDLNKLAETATSQMGKRYVSGGSTPKSGFDCSGFTNWVYGEAGVDIARNSREQYREGAPVARDQLQKGDLVFFGSKKRVHHVGLYLGDGQFIHSTSSGGSVRVSSLDDPVWNRTYAGARRVAVQSAGKDGHKQEG